MKVLICGDRHFEDRNYLDEVLNVYHSYHNFTEVISGGAKGVDTLAVEWAHRNKINYTIFYADWNKYGKAAGPIRNKQMLDEGKPDLAIGFLCPKSKGTFDMLMQALDRMPPEKVIEIKIGDWEDLNPTDHYLVDRPTIGHK